MTPLASDSITFPRSLLKPDSIWAAIDSGSTLLKLVFVDKHDVATRTTDVTFLAHMYHKIRDFEAVLQVIKERVHFPSQNRRLAMTGVGFGFQKDIIEKTLGVELVYVDEIEAMVLASKAFLKYKQSDDIFYPIPPNTKNFKVGAAPWLAEESERMRCRMTSNDHQDKGPPMSILTCGSAFVIAHVDASGNFAPKSIPLIGGLPFLGLAKLWLGTKNYDEIMSLAEKGDVSKCYWLFKDCVPDGGEYGDTDRDFPGFPFGRAFYQPEEEFSKEDMAAALVYFFAQLAHTIAAHVAEITGVSRYYVVGNWVRSELARRFLLEQRAVLHPNLLEFKFFKFSMMTVLGVLLKASEK